MKWVLPITLVLIVILLHMSMRGWQQTALVLASLPFAFAGSIWLLAARHYNLSTAVWVGLIAVGGVAAEEVSDEVLRPGGVADQEGLGVHEARLCEESLAPQREPDAQVVVRLPAVRNRVLLEEQPRLPLHAGDRPALPRLGQPVAW